ncbi:MAG: hypothetical protein V1866_03080 [archaeon]
MFGKKKYDLRQNPEQFMPAADAYIRSGSEQDFAEAKVELETLVRSGVVRSRVHAAYPFLRIFSNVFAEGAKELGYHAEESLDKYGEFLMYKTRSIGYRAADYIAFALTQHIVMEVREVLRSQNSQDHL